MWEIIVEDKYKKSNTKEVKSKKTKKWFYFLNYYTCSEFKIVIYMLTAY